MEFLFRADDEIEQGQSGLQLGGDVFGLNEAAFARPVSGKSPEVGAIVNVERCQRAMFAGKPQRLQNGSLGARMREMCAGRAHTACLGNEIRVDVFLAKRHVGTVLTIENQRKLLLIADAEKHKRGQALRVGDDAARVHALALQFLADEASHMLVADARDQCRLQPEPRRTGSNIGGRTTNIFVEGAHVLQPATDLRAIKIDRGPADGDEVEGLHRCLLHAFLLRCAPARQQGRWFAGNGIPSILIMEDMFYFYRKINIRIPFLLRGGSNGDHEGHRKGERCGKRPEVTEIGLGNRQHERRYGPKRTGNSVCYGDYFGTGGPCSLGQFDGLGRVGCKRDGDDCVALADGMTIVEPADMIVDHRRHVHLLEGIGEIGRDGKGAA